MSNQRRIDRRTFLKSTAGAGAGAALFHIVPASARGMAGRRPAPGNRIALACLGTGGQGTGNMRAFLNEGDVQVVAVCDVDKNRVKSAKEIVDNHYKNGDCAIYTDFREMLARPDLDAMSLATPDHWHGITAITALNAGLDVYGEKPITHCLGEGRALVDAQIRNGRIWQTGSWQRSTGNFHQACELVRNGRLGKVIRIEVGLPTGSACKPQVFKDPPPELDYEFWLGPSRWQPYCAERTHYQWRWQLDYGGGQLMDWIGHHGDIAHWGMGWDNTGPLEIVGKGEYPTEGIWDAATTYHFVATYRGGVEMHVANGGNQNIRSGTKWIGENGNWIWVDRGGLNASPKTLLDEKPGPDEIHLTNSTNHFRNFLDSIRTREPAIAPAETAHRSASIGHLGQIAMLTGRKIRWNPETEQIQDDAAATRMLTTPMRAPWHLS